MNMNLNLKRIIAVAILLAFAIMLAPVPRANADGAASTRNILIGGAAAALLIINHNKKVHQKYAEDAQRQAATASQRDDAWAAYRSEVQAYNRQSMLVGDLKEEVAYQHKVIQQQRTQIASLSSGRSLAMPAAPLAAPAGSHAAKPKANQTRVAFTDGSFGWGSL